MARKPTELKDHTLWFCREEKEKKDHNTSPSKRPLSEKKPKTKI